jgi:hypothetical protein
MTKDHLVKGALECLSTAYKRHTAVYSKAPVGFLVSHGCFLMLKAVSDAHQPPGDLLTYKDIPVLISEKLSGVSVLTRSPSVGG